MISYLFRTGNFSLTQESKTKIGEVLELEEVKRHLRIDPTYTEDDNYIEGLIPAAVTIAENFIEKDIAKTLTELRIDDFQGDWIRINDGNFLSLYEVLNSSDVSIGTVYQTSKHNDFFQIEWTTSLSSDPIKIKYYTGFEDGSVPAAIKQAILIKIADLFDSARSNFSWDGMRDNKVFEAILTPYKGIFF